jgi:branched-chain amino acid transport system substrate-binding protein
VGHAGVSGHHIAEFGVIGRGTRAGFLLACAIAAFGQARAADTVTIGALYPSTDAAAKAAIETVIDIINTPHKGLDALPLGTGEGLPGLGGAKIGAVFADDQRNPAVAISQVLELKRRDHIAALIGAASVTTTLAATAEAERQAVPFLVPRAIEPSITARGLKFTFRTAPLGRDFAKAYAQLLTALKAGGTKVDAIALVFENIERGSAAAGSLREAMMASGFTIAAEIGYAPDGIDLMPQVAALRAANPDVAIFVGDAADAGLLVRTMNTLGYKPPLLIGDDAGFSDPEFVAANGNLAQGAIDRGVWAVGKDDSPSAIVNALYKARTGRDLDDSGALVLQGFLVLADAINRAGSTDGEAIRHALQQTDLKPGQLIVGYDGVRFDASGQNTLGSTYLTQLQGKKYVPVWPAASAAAKLELPYKGWQR